MRTHAITDVGRQRETNEDDVLVDSVGEATILAVADGMGGHAAGDVASEAATNALRATVGEAIEAGRTDHAAVLEDAVRAANDRLAELVAEDPSLSGMGTTLVAALLDGREATIANVGDSRCYHVDDGIEQVTVDQSLVQELVDSGEITPEEAESHPQRNVVSQALGTSESVEPDVYRQSVTGTLLLCSDGLTEEVPEAAIGETVSEGDALSETAQSLVDRANDNGGSDNVSVVLAEPSL
jgi:protein phosphatase